MAKGNAKGKSKAAAATAAPTPKLKSGPPEPYSTPPPALHDFLQALNPKHVYITHIDTHPRSKKISVWLMTAAFNSIIALAVLWRINYILPWYVQVLLGMWGYESKVDVRGRDMSGLWSEVWGRSATFIFDFFIFRYGLAWPVDFFIGETSPTNWRLMVPFKEEEVVVRRSRKWEEKLSKEWLEGEQADQVHRDIIMPAVGQSWITQKTGYLMVDKWWDLDFRAMVGAQMLVKKGTNKLSDFQKTIFVYHETFGWLVWQVWKLDEGAQTEGRKKIVELKDKLTALGKEDLFYRWVEVIQFETSQPGGFTPERQAKAMEEARKLFKSNGVDFDTIWQEIGGGAAPDLSGDK